MKNNLSMKTSQNELELRNINKNYTYALYIKLSEFSEVYTTVGKKSLIKYVIFLSETILKGEVNN